MRQDREKALALRLKGYSYNEINKILGVPKATLSGWFGDLILSDEARTRIQKRVKEGSFRGLLKQNILQTHKARQRAAAIRKIAYNEIGGISKRELILLGSALYWAEGYKKPIIKNGKERTSHVISFTNSDPVMIRLFIRFLKDILHIETPKINAWIRLYEHLNEKLTLQYWQNITDLPRQNFKKFYYGISKSSSRKRPYNRLPYGTIQITVGDTKNFHKIMGWIEGIRRYFR